MANAVQIEYPKTGVKNDHGDHVLMVMKTLGVARTPRNYELFYTAVVDRHKEISDRLKELNANPRQSELDALYEEFLDKTLAAQEVAVVIDSVRRELGDIISTIHREQKAMTNYANVIGRAGGQIGQPSNEAERRLKKVLDTISIATTQEIQRTGEVKKAISEKGEEIKKLRESVEEYRAMAMTDGLTDLKNRRAFDETMERAYKQKYDRTKVGLVIADIDHFKRINDQYGHPVGDKVLKYVSKIFQEELKGKAALIARTGGEEFSFIIAGRSIEEIEVISNSVREKIAQNDIVESASGVNIGHITMSLGVSMMSDAANPVEFYKNSDEALYDAKKTGRNKVCRYKQIKEIPIAKKDEDTWCRSSRRRK